MRRWLALTLCLSVLAACQRSPTPPRFDAPVTFAGGKQVDARTLEEGRAAYASLCAPCHGMEGKGDGPAAATMRPPPRNFRQGLFKFSETGAGNLPTDEALDKTLRHGLQGTPMLPWDLSARRRHALIQYVKTFSERWKEEGVPPPLEISKDPWSGRAKEAIARGEAVFHVAGEGHAGCASCHPAYVSKERLGALYEQVNGMQLEYIPDALHRPQLRETEYPVAYDEKGEPSQVHRLLPTDFLIHPVKRVRPIGARVDGRPYTAEAQRRELYLVIAGGIGGAAMPMWKDALPEENLWALAYYVQSLIEMRGSPEALALRRALVGSSEQKPGTEAP